ncbi:MAG TPA: dihydropteroate synthase [Gemmataceae bacterium]|jgi:dihydropteroate synthase
MGAPLVWRIRDRELVITRPLVMGIVNVTPDSFSDGGHYLETAAAVRHALRLVDEGADLLDVGGESTRPGSHPVTADEELRRVLPVVEELTGRIDIPISVDTSKAEVARQALAAGAGILNDVTAIRGDPEMPAVVRDAGAGVILMHMRGTPATMQQAPEYPEGVAAALDHFFQSRLQDLPGLGIAAECVVLDPGIGFGKTEADNWEVLVRLGELGRFGRPVCLGVSRKGFLGRLLGRPVEDRLAGSLAVACAVLARGSAQILRVHDVAATRDAVRVFERLTQV